MSLKENPDKFRNLSPEELARIEERFQRRRRAGRATPSATSNASRLRVFRIVMISMMLTFILGVVLYQRHAPPYQPPPPPLGDAAPPLDDALVPPPCRAVADAHFAYLPGLAEGSLTAQEAQRTTMLAERVPLEIENTVGMRFRLIPAGTFMMGSPADEAGRATDETEHVRTVRRPYYLGATEVTQAQWDAVMGDTVPNPSGFRSSPQLPVESITWEQAVAFCRRLSELEGQPIGTYRLPTEVEWEYACRAGTQTPYSFAGGPDEMAPYARNNFRNTLPVGTLRPNAFGLYDMHGNVWEWCSNQFFDYVTGERDKRFRSLRGGMWRLTEPDCRSATRFRYTPTSSGYVLGLRVLRTIDHKTLRAEVTDAADAADSAAATGGTGAADAEGDGDDVLEGTPAAPLPPGDADALDPAPDGEELRDLTPVAPAGPSTMEPYPVSEGDPMDDAPHPTP